MKKYTSTKQFIEDAIARGELKEIPFDKEAWERSVIEIEKNMEQFDREKK